MLKVFRSIRQKLFNGGNVRKYLLYALGEILLVMIGIILALQFNNWNINRINKQKEKILLEQLHEEFLGNKEQLEIVVQGHNSSLMQCKKLLKLMPIDPNTINLDTVDSYLKGSFSRWTFNPSSNIIDAITNTSSYEIISDPHLRRSILNWNGALEDYIEDEQYALNYLTNSIFPYLRNQFSLRSNNWLKDERLDISFLSTPLFENLIHARMMQLELILEKEEDDEVELELNVLVAIIDEIISLTKTQADS